MSVIITLLILWLIIIAVGFLVKALLWLAIVGVVLFIVTVAFGVFHTVKRT